MKYTKIRENLKRKEKIEIIKIKLLTYGKSLKLIDDILLDYQLPPSKEGGLSID